MSRSLRSILTASAGVFLLAGCRGNPSQPTPPPVDPPKISCPAPVSVQSRDGQPTPVVYDLATATGGAPPFIIMCSPASGSAFQIGSTPVECVATDQRQRIDRCVFTLVVTEPPRLSLTNFVAFGDSMTAGEVVSAGSVPGVHVLTVVPGAAYPTVLQSALMSRYTAQTISVAREGRQREVTEDGRSRLSRVLADRQYQVLLLMEGANDLATQTTASMQRALFNMRAMVDDAKGRGVAVFLATIPPENPDACCPRYGSAASWVPLYNDGIRNVAASRNVPLVDLYQAFNGDASTLIDRDGLHPTAAGYQLIAETFFESIKQVLELPPTSIPVGAQAFRPADAGLKPRATSPTRSMPFFVLPGRR
jgi:lysophospholipase L1-like esterase